MGLGHCKLPGRGRPTGGWFWLPVSVKATSMSIGPSAWETQKSSSRCSHSELHFKSLCTGSMIVYRQPQQDPRPIIGQPHVQKESLSRLRVTSSWWPGRHIRNRDFSTLFLSSVKSPPRLWRGMISVVLVSHFKNPRKDLRVFEKACCGKGHDILGVGRRKSEDVTRKGRAEGWGSWECPRKC